MSISAITIENFKGIKDPVKIELKPITLLFGPNSAGKSTIVQALHYAREIFARANLNPDSTIAGGKSINLGGFNNLVYDNDLSREVRLRLDLDLEEVDLADFFVGNSSGERNGDISDWKNGVFECLSKVNSAWAECTIRWDEEVETPDVISYRVGINGFLLAKIENSHSEFTEVTFYSHDILKDTKLFDLDYQTRKDLLKEFESQQSLTPPHEYSEMLDHEMDVLDHYERELELYTDKDGDSDISKYVDSIDGIFLDQESALPKWDEKLEFIEPFWEDENDGRLFHEGLLNTLILGPGLIIREHLADLTYLGPIRDVPPRNHIPSLSPDESLWASGVAAWDLLYKSNARFIDDLNDWLSEEEGLDSGYSVELKEYRELETESPLMLAVLQGRLLDEDINLRESITKLPIKRRLLIRDLDSNADLSPQDIGVGISQVLPVVVAALHKKIGIVAIEQPELHIHPALQVSLGDLFIERIRKYPDLFFILETHSEHLMLRFLRRIRETSEQEAPDNRDLFPGDLSIYFMEKGEGGISCTNIRVDDEGDFVDHWPKGFFAERAEELF